MSPYCLNAIIIVIAKVVQLCNSPFSVMVLTSNHLATANERCLCYRILPESSHTLLAHAGLRALLRLDNKIARKETHQD